MGKQHKHNAPEEIETVTVVMDRNGVAIAQNFN